jgi:Zn-dependent M16 (insulinase) family peptidase
LHWKRYSSPLKHQSEVRPWVTSPPVCPLKSSQSKVVEFPEEDESIGEYVLTCFGPDANVYLNVSTLTP